MAMKKIENMYLVISGNTRIHEAFREVENAIKCIKATMIATYEASMGGYDEPLDAILARMDKELNEAPFRAVRIPYTYNGRHYKQIFCIHTVQMSDFMWSKPAVFNGFERIYAATYNSTPFGGFYELDNAVDASKEIMAETFAKANGTFDGTSTQIFKQMENGLKAMFHQCQIIYHEKKKDYKLKFKIHPLFVGDKAWEGKEVVIANN